MLPPKEVVKKYTSKKKYLKSIAGIISKFIILEILDSQNLTDRIEPLIIDSPTES